jgi:UDP-GlcNAc3NAcA epimerase
VKTIISVVGARPQFIKHAPMQIELVKHFNALTIHTGQHYDKNMSDVFFDELGISQPDFKLKLNAGLPQGEQTALIMVNLEKICFIVKPELMVVYGDTNSTLAAVLVAVKLNIPIVHVEAGLRSNNLSMPEEINRIIADRFSSLLFCPNQDSVTNLRKEGIDHDGIFVCGDVMCDMLRIVENKLKNLISEPYILLTIHRPYNTDNVERLLKILEVLNSLSIQIIFPIHPRTLSKLKNFNSVISKLKNIIFRDPVGYIDSLSLQKFSSCVITDSGGVQKEAYMLKKLCITIRSETEWTETLNGGWNTLVFEDLERLPELINRKPKNYNQNLFGNGSAAKFIVNQMLLKFNI